MTDTPDTPAARRAAIAARCEAATEGPWRCYNGWGPVGNTGLMAINRIGPIEYGKGIIADPDRPARADLYATREDAEFIAHAREDVPWLLAQLAAAEREIAGLRDRLADASHVAHAAEARVVELEGALREIGDDLPGVCMENGCGREVRALARRALEGTP